MDHWDLTQKRVYLHNKYHKSYIIVECNGLFLPQKIDAVITVFWKHFISNPVSLCLSLSDPSKYLIFTLSAKLKSTYHTFDCHSFSEFNSFPEIIK